MKLLVLLPNWAATKKFIFSVFWVNFFCNIFSSEFPIKLPNDLSYSIHVFYKRRLQKKRSTVAEKFELILIILISLTKKNQRSKFGRKVLYQVNFKIQ